MASEGTRQEGRKVSVGSPDRIKDADGPLEGKLAL